MPRATTARLPSRRGSAALVGGDVAVQLWSAIRRMGARSWLNSSGSIWVVAKLPSSTPQNGASVWRADFGRTARRSGVRHSQLRIRMHRLGQLEDLVGDPVVAAR